MGRLIVVTGPPGAGKSTVAEVVADRLERSAHVEGDAFFGFVRSGYVAPWLPESHEQNAAVTAAAAAATAQLCAWCDVVYDGVIGPWFLPTFIEMCGAESVHYVVLLPRLEVCVERVRTRAGHGFTDLAAAEQMWREFSDAAPAGHVLMAEDDPTTVASLVLARVADGSLQIARAR